MQVYDSAWGLAEESFGTMHSMKGMQMHGSVCEESCGQCIGMHGYAGTWILCEESCGQCIVCSGMHVGNGQECV